jgi:menaquinol-cytochrome c reductase iron-sulfur subunit
MSDPHPTPPPPERRKFLKWLTHGLGALFGVVLGAPAVAYLIDPRNRAARQRGFKRVAKVSDLQPNVPTQVVIRDVNRDAWTMQPNEVVGRVWLVLRDGNKVDAYTTICPHLGCSVNHDAKQNLFICPCHNGTFDCFGKRQEHAAGGGPNPPPRNMDTLEIKLEEAPPTSSGKPDSFVDVRYQNFVQGKEEKVVKK